MQNNVGFHSKRFCFTLKSCGSLGSVESNTEQGVMFADWAAGLLNTTPDPQTTERHVSSMVEVRTTVITVKSRHVKQTEFTVCSG